MNRFLVTLDFISPYPLDECVSRLDSLDEIPNRWRFPGRNFVRVNIDRVHKIKNQRTCEFRIYTGYQRYVAEAIGYLLENPDKSSTYIGGQVRFSLFNFAIVVFWSIAGPPLLVVIAKALELNVSPLTIFPFLVAYLLAWFSMLSRRNKLVSLIQDILDAQPILPTDTIHHG